MHSSISGESRAQTPRIANGNHLIPTIVKRDDEWGTNILWFQQSVNVWTKILRISGPSPQARGALPRANVHREE